MFSEQYFLHPSSGFLGLSDLFGNLKQENTAGIFVFSMAKRFTSTEIWGEDWFLDMPNDYKMFWFYMLSNCSHSGLFKVNLRTFSRLIEVNIEDKKALSLFNQGKDRITELKNNFWYIEDYFVYQYGTTFNINNRVHFSVMKELKSVGLEIENIRGLKGVNLTLKDKEKDKDISTSLNNKKGVEEISAMMAKHGTINPQQFFERYTNEPEYKEGIKILASKNYTTEENILAWVEKFRTRMIVEAVSKPMSEFVSHFNNWLNLSYKPNIDPNENKNPNERTMVY